MPSLAVLTRDLRLQDNPTLDTGADTVVLFVDDPSINALHGSPNRRAYLVETLRELSDDLSDRGSRLVYRRGPWQSTVLEVAASVGAERIDLARDVSGFAQARNRRLASSSHLPVIEHDSLTVVAPDRLAPASGPFYKVFTPFYRKWSEVPMREPVPVPRLVAGTAVESDPLPEVSATGTSPRREPGGRRAAERRLAEWLPRVGDYGDTRDALATRGTSQISAALHFGVLSPVEVVDAAIDGAAFVRQVAWRDFNAQILFHRPDASRHDFVDRSLLWKDDDAAFEAWTSATTGFPIVDAAMRQLTETGWMHNRTRMVTASFLTKDLAIDWRRGAAWFMQWLTDGDIANNQLGWQWVAGTGTDTNPTRIFNPTRQSERFDPDGTYIRRWLPELADVDTAEIHDPSPLTRATTGYPLPIVDHHEAIREFKELRGWG